MWDAALIALERFADPLHMGMLMAGVLAGTVIGILPGLGGIACVAILLPFIYTLDVHTAMILLVGSLAVVHTPTPYFGADRSPGRPGCCGDGSGWVSARQAGPSGQGPERRLFVVDDRRSHRRGFLDSICPLRGLWCCSLALPIVDAVHSRSFFRGLSHRRRAAQGRTCSMPRPVVRASAPLPRMPSIATPSASSICSTAFPWSPWHWVFLASPRSSIYWPKAGVSPSESAWVMAGSGCQRRDATLGHCGARITHRCLGGNSSGHWGYGGILDGLWARGRHGPRPRKIREGRHSRRIGPESANNSVDAGDLIPTLLFGVPGGAPSAILLGALFFYGIQPGPRMVEENLDLIFTIIWSFAFANTIGAGLCFFLSPSLARFTSVPFSQLAPAVMVTIFSAPFRALNTSAISMPCSGWGCSAG